MLKTRLFTDEGKVGAQMGHKSVFILKNLYLTLFMSVFESGLRTIGTSIDVDGRLFVPEIRATQGFSRFSFQQKSI